MASLDLSKVKVNQDFVPSRRNSKDQRLSQQNDSMRIESSVAINNVINASISSIQYSANSQGEASKENYKKTPRAPFIQDNPMYLTNHRVSNRASNFSCSHYDPRTSRANT